MKAQDVKDTIDLTKFGGLSQSEKESLWDSILNVSLCESRLKCFRAMRNEISDMIDLGVPFSFATSVYKKAELDGHILGEERTSVILIERLMDTMANVGLSGQSTKLIHAIVSK